MTSKLIYVYLVVCKSQKGTRKPREGYIYTVAQLSMTTQSPSNHSDAESAGSFELAPEMSGVGFLRLP